MTRRPVLLVALVLFTAIARGQSTQPTTAPSTQPTTAPSTQPTIEPLKITLHLHDAPVIDVIKSIEWQTGLALLANHAAINQYVKDKVMSIDVDDASFWEVTKILKDSASVGVMQSPDPDHGRLFMLIPSQVQMWGHNLADMNGLFSVFPIRAYVNRVVRFGAGQSENTSFLSLQVVPDPAVQLAQTNCVTTVNEVIDENGRNIISPTQTPVLGGGGGSTIQPKMRVVNGNRRLMVQGGANVQLIDSAQNGKMVAHLSGVVRCTGTPPLRQLRFMDPAKDSQGSTGDTTVQIIQIKTEPKQISLRIRITQTPDAPPWNPTALPAVNFSMIDENGDSYIGHTVTAGVDKGTYDVTLNPVIPFANLGVVQIGAGGVPVNGPQPGQPGATSTTIPSSLSHRSLMISLPGPKTDFVVPFELKDLPLP